MGLFSRKIKKAIAMEMYTRGMLLTDDKDEDDDFYDEDDPECENCPEHMQMVERDPQTNIVYYQCPCCGSTGHMMPDGDFIFEDSPCGRRPRVCTGCGSDMYPDCQESCKYFDD